MTQRYGQDAENPSRCAPVVPSTCRPSDWTVLLFLDGRCENSAGQKVRLLHLDGGRHGSPLCACLWGEAFATMSWAEKASSTAIGLGSRVQGVLERAPSPPQSPSRPVFALRQRPTTASFLHRRTHELSKHVVSLSSRIRAILARASQMTAGPSTAISRLQVQARLLAQF